MNGMEDVWVKGAGIENKPVNDSFGGKMFHITLIAMSAIPRL